MFNRLTYVVVTASLTAVGVSAAEPTGFDGEALALTALKDASDEIAPETEQVGDLVTGRLVQRGSKETEILLEKAACYKLLAVAGDGIDDLSLYMEVDGKEVASDRISGKRPMIEWCSPGAVRVKVVLASYSGQGSYALGVFMKKPSNRKSAMRVGGAGTDFTANRIRQMHKQFGKGRAAVSPLFRGNLSRGDTGTLEVRLKAKHCYTIIAAGNPTVRDLDIALMDLKGREIGRDTTCNSFPVVETDPCVTASGAYHVRVEMAAGSGEYGVQVFSD